ncbi:MAG: hypothetical protein AB1921_00075 [Thermodesulfobacteriota bacterium]
MKKSFVTWRIGFASLPDREKIRKTAGLLAPLAKVEKPEDYGVVAREYGLHDLLFLEPEEELTAAEIALNVLSKAHRLAKGWSIVWPSFTQKSEKGLTEDEIRRAAFPESLDGLSGCVNRSFSFVRIPDPQIESVSFSVKVTSEGQPAEVRKPPTKERREERPAAAPGPEAVAVLAALGRLLVSHRTTIWKWDLAGAVKQVEGLGFRPGEEDCGALAFTAPGGTVCRIMAEGERVMWVEFVLSSCKDPHLLDEEAFSRKQEEYEALFLQAVHYAKALLGAPVFSGASGEGGFPSDQWADFAAVWKAPGGRLMIQQKHNDKELPLELCLTFAPEA